MGFGHLGRPWNEGLIGFFPLVFMSTGFYLFRYFGFNFCNSSRNFYARRSEILDYCARSWWVTFAVWLASQGISLWFPFLKGIMRQAWTWTENEKLNLQAEKLFHLGLWRLGLFWIMTSLHIMFGWIVPIIKHTW